MPSTAGLQELAAGRVTLVISSPAIRAKNANQGDPMNCCLRHGPEGRASKKHPDPSSLEIQHEAALSRPMASISVNLADHFLRSENKRR